MRKSVERRNLNVNLPLETFNRIDDYAKKYQIPRTAAVAILINSALDNKQSMDAIVELVDLAKQEAIKNAD